MADNPGAVLVAEIGSLITRVTLIDQVEGESRMVGHAETSTSVEAPYNNALYGILEAAAALTEMTGRELLRDGQLIMPQSSERDGVNQVVVVSSAAGAMMLVIAAIARDISAQSAIQASRATYTALLQVVTLDDAAGQPTSGPAGRSWIERQVETLLSLRPDSVLIAGGLEHGAVDAVNRLAHIVGLTAYGSGLDAGGQQRQEVTARPVIYAGNSAARERVVEALSDRAAISVVDNLRPALDQANLDPARIELARLYEKQMLVRLPGIGSLRRMSQAPVRTVCEVMGLMTRFLAERTTEQVPEGRRVLTVDAGASASAAFYAAPGRFQPAVLGTTGTAYGLTGLLAEPGVAALMRWLPFPCDEVSLTERLLNRALRPQCLPASRDDLYVEHALAREALRAAYGALREEAPADDYDWLFATGGILAHAPQPGLALLTLLDALEPRGEHDRPIIDVHLDTLGLLAVGGALAGLDPDAAVTVIERDLLRNAPLASVVTLLGDGRYGEVAAEVELRVVGGRSERVSVRHGELVRLALPQGRFGQLKVSPAGGVRVGQAAPGEMVETDGGDIAGSLLGVVIDARGRPLRLPEEGVQRRERLWQWLVALGVEREQSPYAGLISEPLEPLVVPDLAEPPAPPEAEPALGAVPASAAQDAPAPVVAAGEVAAGEVAAGEVAPAGAPGRRISLDELRAQVEEPAPAPEPERAPALESDLDALRQTVEAPKRRGLFGRKK